MSIAHRTGHTQLLHEPFPCKVQISSKLEGRFRQEVALLTEELRNKDARMRRIPVQRRPHFPPAKRLAILELRAARGWNSAQTVRWLLVTPTTVASCTARLDDEGPASSMASRIAMRTTTCGNRRAKW